MSTVRERYQTLFRTERDADQDRDKTRGFEGSSDVDLGGTDAAVNNLKGNASINTPGQQRFLTVRSYPPFFFIMHRYIGLALRTCSCWRLR